MPKKDYSKHADAELMIMIQDEDRNAFNDLIHLYNFIKKYEKNNVQKNQKH